MLKNAIDVAIEGEADTG